ncbi:MAG: ribosomal protein S18-alanine N-acetyltransferase [Polyangiaceae bacterium]|jgi:ribosomal-protein-alanine N-acetyltransferase|nr:ribosomal protein S18-alanine N-acetyltransferase [Polyangiaceae bacterium]
MKARIERLGPGATGQDLAACAAVERRAFAHGQLDLVSELQRPHARLWVARGQTGEPEGFLLAWYLAGDLEIQTVAVDPARRREGLGRALVGAALVEARALGCERVLLEVRAGNEGARALYRGAGFTEDGLRRRYYSDPEEDAVLMSQGLTEEKNRDPGRLVG